MGEVEAGAVAPEAPETPTGIDRCGCDLDRTQRSDGSVHCEPFGNAAEIDGQWTSEAHMLAALQNHVAPVAARTAAEMRGQQSPACQNRRDGEIERAFRIAGDTESALQDVEGGTADFHGAAGRRR